MRTRRIPRILIVLTAFALSAVLIPGLRAAPAAAVPGGAKARPAATAGRSGFDPAHGYVPGSPQPLSTPAGGPSGTTQSPQHADANGGTLGVDVSGSSETAQGTPMTSTLPGGDSLQVYSLGVVNRVRPDGSTVWQRGTGSLYHDWHLTFTNGGYTPTPQLVFGTDPADPFYLTTDQQDAMNGIQPYAVGDLNGDGSPDVAVAETVGVNLGAATCWNCGWPFTVPGSDLHYGTFVTVLDSRTGKTLYSELDPGFVTQLAISGHDLVVGDETGSPTAVGGPGAWDSVSTVRALSLRTARGTTSATQVWRYSTGAQWGRLLGVRAVDGGAAVSWSDTPLGLGSPRPPDGHVVMIDSHGHVRWDQRTAGYPVLSQYDAGRGLLAVVEQTDPTEAVSYTLAGLRVSDGHTVTAVPTDGVLPTELTVGRLTAHGGTSWIVSGVVTTAALVRPPGYSFTSASVSAVDPGAARTLWTRTLAPTGSTQSPPQPGTIAVVPASHGSAAVVVGSYLGSVKLTPASPVEGAYDIQGLSGADGTSLWEHSGSVITPQSLAADGSRVRGVTADQDAVVYDANGGGAADTTPLIGDLYAAVASDVNGDGRPDDIAGGQSGALFAFDGRTLTPGNDVPRVLWRADVGGPVHKITAVTVDGRRVLAVAATSGLALVDARTGRVLHRMALPGQYVWNVAVGSVGGRTVVVTATDRISAFDASTGQALWTYQPSTASYFSNTSVTGGMVVGEYQNQGSIHQAATSMAAIGLDAVTGQTAWTAAGDPTQTRSAQLTNGVVAGAGIPGAGTDGAAFAWNTLDGQGRVDVRDARTGALLYADTDETLAQHESYVLDPRVGLVATGDFGSVSVTPSGPQTSASAAGTDAAVVTTGSTPALLTADIGLHVYPLSALSTGSAAVLPVAVYQPFQTGQLSVTGDDEVLTMPVDWRRHEILTVEAGQLVHPYNVTIQHGLVGLSLTGTPAAKGAKAAPQTAKALQTPQASQTPQAPGASVTAPGTLPLGSGTAADSRIATVQPAGQMVVRGTTKAGTPQLTAASPSGYDPAALRSYLGLTGTGAGQTVAVVDAPGDSHIAADVDQFSAQFGLDQVCAGTATSGCFQFTVSAPDGTGPDDAGWGLETAMDVEWIHAVAPKAAVVLVEGHDGTSSSLFRAVDAAAALHPDAIGMSWGLPGEFTDETYYDQHCELADSVCSVSTGDSGHPGSYPAYNPYVLSVGGTTLKLAGDGTVTGETSWSESGGGRSYVEPTPAYQQGVVTGGRGTPDVSFDADPATGVAVYDSVGPNGQSGWFQVGGTSLGAPSWAAILASADQLRAAAGRPRLASADGSAQRAVYAATSHLGDITAGPANGFCPAMCAPSPGYDFVTGVGSPRAGLDTTLAGAS